METKSPQLNSWSIYKSNTGHSHLHGMIYDDDRFADGHYVATSRIQSVSRINDVYYISTEHTTYYCEERKYYNGSYTCASVMQQLNLEEEN